MTRPDLREFARVVLNEFWVPGIFSDDIDGGTLQDIAEKYVLLEPHTVTEPCGEGCNCEDFPGTCYRVHPSLVGENHE